MSKCTEIICDLCGEHIGYEDVVYDNKSFSLIKIKTKEFWHSFHEYGWNKKTIHICPFCQIKINKFFRSDNNGMDKC